MMVGRIEIPHGIRVRIGGLALAALPDECCGILLGEGAGELAIVLDAHSVENTHSGDRGRFYAIGPEALLAAHRVARDEGLEVVGFFHSHPSGDARPSVHDRDTAWPAMSYLIISVGGGGIRELRCWRLGDDGREFVEEEILYAHRPIRRDEVH